jgi:23S rRNA (guanosine2251-2'-O)-methyltransferase
MVYLEGRQSVFAALSARRRRFQVILIRHDTHEEKLSDLIELAGQLNVPIRRVDRAELDAMAHGATHGGVLAVCSPRPLTSADEILELVDRASSPPLFLLLEGVDDARNLGFTLRTAEAMGVDAVLVKKHLWDFDEAEVSRPSSGAFERLPMAQIGDVELIHQLRKRGVQLFGCIAGAKRTMYDVDLSQSAILAIGGEKRGLSGAVRQICDRLITIPTVGGASSLSLSHAGAIVLAEALRQRRKPIQPPENC